MARTAKSVKPARQARGLGPRARSLSVPRRPAELGRRIYEKVWREAWQMGQAQQPRLINEIRLNLADPRARKYLLDQTEKFFFGGGADEASGFVPIKK